MLSYYLTRLMTPDMITERRGGRETKRQQFFVNIAIFLVLCLQSGLQWNSDFSNPQLFKPSDNSNQLSLSSPQSNTNFIPDFSNPKATVDFVNFRTS